MAFIYLNEKKIVLKNKKTTIYNVLKDNNINIDGIALALNYKVIKAEKWDKTMLAENDKILIVTAAQGG